MDRHNCVGNIFISHNISPKYANSPIKIHYLKCAHILNMNVYSIYRLDAYTETYNSI